MKESSEDVATDVQTAVRDEGTQTLVCSHNSVCLIADVVDTID